MTPEELRDPAVLERGLTYAIGLLPVGEPRFDPAPLTGNPNPPTLPRP